MARYSTEDIRNIALVGHGHAGKTTLADLILSAEQTADQEKRKAIYTQALGVIADQAYWAPLFSYSANYLVSPQLDFPLDPDGLPRLQNATWK